MTIERVKKLEMAQQEMVQTSHDPYNPWKCMSKLQQPEGEPQGSSGKGKERAKDDDEVSLDFSGDKMEWYHNDADMDKVNLLTVILILNTGDIVRISPVYHVPTLTCQLLAMGRFLQSGYTCTGNKDTIRIMKGSKPFLTFNPRYQKDSLYIIKSYVANKTDIHMALNTIYGVNFDIIHRHLVHPSKEVLLKARKHLKDFPEIEFAKEEHLCPGCAQGKMTNRSFPPSTRRASQPFKLIHSDLRSFPIDSYHKYRYVIVFLDNNTTTVWTVNLCTQDAALTATFQFIELVKKKFNTTIIQWMSDAGGEYKSKAFEKMLKN